MWPEETRSRARRSRAANTSRPKRARVRSASTRGHGSGSGQNPVDRRGKIVVAVERRPEFAVGQRIARAADRQPERRRAGCHRFEKGDAKPLAG